MPHTIRDPTSRRPKLSAALLAIGVALSLAVPVATATATGVTHLTHAQHARRTTAKRPAEAFVTKCMKSGGLGHIRRLSTTRWQGTIGEEPDSNIKDSMFVFGPYTGTGVAAMALRALPKSQLGFQGGRFIVVGSRALAYDQIESFIAACVKAGGSKGYSF